MYIRIYVDYVGSRHFADDPVCPDPPVWRLRGGTNGYIYIYIHIYIYRERERVRYI